MRDLLEGKQVGVLYHFTGLSFALSIVDDNKLYAGHQHSSKFMSLSFTRNKKFIDINNQGSSIGGNDIAFIVNGNKLTDKYQIKPIHDRSNFGDEFEEIVYGKLLEKDRGITNFNQYSNQILLSTQLLKKLKGEIPLIKRPTKFDYLIYKNFGKDFDQISYDQKINRMNDWFQSKGFSIKGIN